MATSTDATPLLSDTAISWTADYTLEQMHSPCVSLAEDSCTRTYNRCNDAGLLHVRPADGQRNSIDGTEKRTPPVDSSAWVGVASASAQRVQLADHCR
jgi:hypothetical protein